MAPNKPKDYGKVYTKRNTFDAETMASRKKRNEEYQQRFSDQFNMSPWAYNMSNQFGSMTNTPGGDFFDPNSKIQYTAQRDVAALQPLPQGRFFQPGFGSEESLLTEEQIKKFREDPQLYKDKAEEELNAEQSLLDRGKTMMQRLFDIQDEKDLELFGMDLAIVETVWDGAWGILKGVENVKNIGLGGLISAMPGGIDTLSYDELSGGNDLGDVLLGKMKDDTAPTPFQIAIASVAEESKRIREGGARATDILLLNPATAPFILAGIMEEDSPLQADGFDFMDDDQRKEAFSEGYEKFFSGLGDASLLFADPLIAATVWGKVAKAGALGLRGSARTREYMTVANQEASRVIISSNDEVRQGVDRVGAAWDADVEKRLRPEELKDRTWEQLSPDEQYAVAVKGFGDEVGIDQVIVKEIPDTIQEGSQEWLVMSLAQVAEDGKTKVMDLETIRNLTGFQNPTGQALAEVIYNLRDPMQIQLALGHTMGLPGASAALKRLAPAVHDQTRRLAQLEIAKLAMEEPDKISLAVGMIDNMLARVDSVADARRAEKGDRNFDQLKADSIDPNKTASQQQAAARDAREVQRLDDEISRLEAMNAEFRATRDQVTGTVSDFKYRNLTPEELKDVDAVVDDMLVQDDALARALSRELEAARDTLEVPMAAMRAQQGMTGNTLVGAYNRRILKKDVKKATAKGQFQREGTSILNRKRIVRVEQTPAGPKPIYEKDGWFSRSVFSPEGEGRFASGLRRNLRVWRYMGQATPSGWLGLKGTGKVGMQKELEAMMDIDFFRGDAIEMVGQVDEATGLTRTVGGTAGRDKLINDFMAKFYDPRNIDDPLTALKALEVQILQEMAEVYGMRPEAALRLAKFGQDTRAGFMDQIKQTGYFVDEAGEINYAPWIAENASNGAQTLPFQAIEKALKKLQKTDGGVKQIDNWPNFVGTPFQWFNDIWRPATLLRASYTQRNVFEGLLRAMAYQTSIIPLTWPARAIYNGTRNIRKGRGAEKEAKRVLELTAPLRATQRRYQDAQQTVKRLQRKRREAVRDGANDVKLEEMDRAIQAATVNANNLKGASEEAILRIDELVADTKFGTWRAQQLEALDAEAAGIAQMNADLLEMAGAKIDAAALSGATDLGEVARKAGVEGDALKALDDMQIVQDQLRAINDARKLKLQTDLGAGLQEYMAQASRRRHIGSGMSLGPDGNYYHDAWTGPLAQMNRQLMSSDNTVKQQLVLQMNASTSILFANIRKARQPVLFDNKTPATLDEVSVALAEVMDLYASNRLIQKMVELKLFDDAGGGVIDWTPLRRWVTETEEGRQWWRTSRKIFGEDNTSDIAKLKGMGFDIAEEKGKEVAKKKRIKDPSVDTREMGMGYDDEFLFDPKAIDDFFTQVMDRVEISLWNDPELMGIFQNQVFQQIAQKADIGGIAGSRQVTTGRAVGTSTEGRQLPAARSIRSVIDGMDIDDGVERYVVADKIIEVTNKTGMDSFRTWTAKLFKYLGTIPEDSVVRGPFYAERFKDARNRLIQGEMESQNIAYTIATRNDGNIKVGDIQHTEFKLTPEKLRDIEAKAHAQALSDTREWMYTIERRTKLGKYGEYVLPFISAMQNSVTVMGKLIRRDPSLPFITAAIWRFPDRAGWTDDEGNIVMPIVAPGLQEYLNENPDIPIIGGILDDKANILIPKDGLNVVMPESGYGLVPRMTPLTTMTASELMKRGLISPETPEILKKYMGEEQGAEAYQIIKDYIFGEGRGPSTSNLPFSTDKVLPAYLQKFYYALFDQGSALYGYQFSLHQATEMARYRAQERDEMPTVKEINTRTRNSLLWQALGNQGIPTPQTPYPVLTRPTIEPAEAVLGDIYRMYQSKAYETNSDTALRDFTDNFGLWAGDISQMKGTKGTGGANIVPETVTDIKRHSDLIGEVSGAIGPNYTNVLGILVNNRRSQVSYDPGANAVLRDQDIPGLNKKWRTALGPNERLMEAQRSVGWMEYRKLMDGLDAELAARGLRNYQQKGAEDLSVAKKTFIYNARNNPDMEGWVMDYEDAGGGKTNAALTVMTAALNSDDYTQWMINNGMEGTLASMEQYFYYRNGIINMLNQVEGSINNPDNIQIKIAWENIRQQLKNNDVRWAEIADLYLTADEDPRSPGLAYEVKLDQQGVMANGG